MDSTETGGRAPEEKSEGAEPQEAVTEETPAVQVPPAGGQPMKRNWTLIALIAVSCIAVLLLAATIALAVTGGYCRHKGRVGIEKFGDRGMGPMQRRGYGPWRYRVPDQQKSSATQNSATQPAQPTTPQPETTAPSPGQSP